ncbi:hypothetical protein MMC26_006170 [Xylographa opegraphella]|nr:hypothetical protein [Xylographa opegraphella]
MAAIVLTAGRYAIRGWMLRKLDWDDATHLFALVVLVAYVATYTAMFPINYAVEDWVTGNGEMPSIGVLDLYLHYEMAVWLLFWVIIYLVKFSFLLFYRSIFGVSRTFKKAWWAVTVFTFLTFWACFFAMLWSCNKPSLLFIVEECLSKSALNIQAVFVTMWCILNIISDLSIMALPLWMLKGLRISRAQKIGLAAIFLIAFIDILFDILRTIYTVNGAAVGLDTTFDILEPSIAVIISTLPTYRALFMTRRRTEVGSSFGNMKTSNISTSAQSAGGEAYELSPSETGFDLSESGMGLFSDTGRGKDLVEPRSEGSMDSKQYPVDRIYQAV